MAATVPRSSAPDATLAGPRWPSRASRRVHRRQLAPPACKTCRSPSPRARSWAWSARAAAARSMTALVADAPAAADRRGRRWRGPASTAATCSSSPRVRCGARRGRPDVDGLSGADDRARSRRSRVGSQIAEVDPRPRERPAPTRRKPVPPRCSTRLGIPNATRRLDDYPHQFSGGMRQRVMLALALVHEPEAAHRRRADDRARRHDPGADPRPDLPICGEISGLSVILITHDLGVVNEIADRVAVMYAGEIVEIGAARRSSTTRNTRTRQGLLKSMPYLTTRQASAPRHPRPRPRLWAMPPACRFAARCPNRIAPCLETHPDLREPIDATMSSAATTPRPSRPLSRCCECRGLTKRFPVADDFFGRATSWLVGGRRCHLDIRAGETLALVGESGSGKIDPGSADPAPDRTDRRLASTSTGTTCCTPSPAELRGFRQRAQIIFQDPFDSLDPADESGRDRRRGDGSPRPRPSSADGSGSRELLDLVHLPRRRRSTASRTSSPAASGSASASPARSPSSPTFIVADEPVSALDVSMQSQDPQPAARPAGPARPHLPLHQPRHERRPPHGRPGRSHVPRPDRRDRAGRRALPQPAPPLHAGAPLLRAVARAAGASAAASCLHGECRRRSTRRRLPLRQPLLPRPRALLAGDAAARHRPNGDAAHRLACFNPAPLDEALATAPTDARRARPGDGT